MNLGRRVLVVSGWLLMVIGVLALIFFAGSAVLFRDGLGPDSVSSHGALAIKRTFEGLWVPGVLSIAVFARVSHWCER
jgi:hypothetical protein